MVNCSFEIGFCLFLWYIVLLHVISNFNCFFFSLFTLVNTMVSMDEITNDILNN